MAADVRLKIDKREVGEAFEQLLGRLPERGDASLAMMSMARVLKTGAQMRFRTQRGPDGQAWKKSRRVLEEGGQTLSKSNLLRRSITAAHDRTTATVGTNIVYAAIHQFGGIIRAKKGPFLSIPVTPAARDAGSPRKFPGLHVQQTVRGQFVLADDKGTVHYLLKRQVTMPERPFLGASDSDKTALINALRGHLEGAWKR